MRTFIISTNYRFWYISKRDLSNFKKCSILYLVYLDILVIRFLILEHQFHGVEGFLKGLFEGLRVGDAGGGERGYAEDDVVLLGVVADSVAVGDDCSVTHEGSVCGRGHLM